MSAALERARMLAGRAADARRQEMLADALEIPGVTARIEAEDLVIEGRALLDRWVSDARLRYLGRARR